MTIISKNSKAAQTFKQTFYIPQGFDPSVYTELKPQDYDKCRYILHKIYEQRILDKTLKNDPFVRLKASILQNIIGVERYGLILKCLSRDMIDIDDSYQVGAYSKGYKFKDNIKDRLFIKLTCTNSKITNKLFLRRQDAINSLPKDRETQYKYRCLLKMAIRHKEALAFINDKLKNDLLYTREQYNYDLMSIEKINNREYFFIIDKKGGREHTNISNLSSYLRAFIFERDTFGKQYVNIDVCNSQPYLFNFLLNNFYNISNTSYEKGKSHAAVYQQKQLFKTLPKDVQLYQSLTAKGEFYEYIMKEMRVPLKDRQEFKINFFGKIFFCNDKKTWKYTEEYKFKKLFPNVYKVIQFYKQDGYKNLPIKLQRTEAKIFLKDITHNILHNKTQENPWFATIHDSIIVEKKHAEFITSIVKTCFHKSFGKIPTIKINQLI